MKAQDKRTGKLVALKRSYKVQKYLSR